MRIRLQGVVTSRMATEKQIKQAKATRDRGRDPSLRREDRKGRDQGREGQGRGTGRGPGQGPGTERGAVAGGQGRPARDHDPVVAIAAVADAPTLPEVQDPDPGLGHETEVGGADAAVTKADGVRLAAKRVLGIAIVLGIGDRLGGIDQEARQSQAGAPGQATPGQGQGTGAGQDIRWV